MSRIFVYSLGFLNRPLNKMMTALGWWPRIGLPNASERVGIWGRKPVSKRGIAVARFRGAGVVSFEDGFLRSVQTGRQGAAGLSLIADDLGIYFETGQDNCLHQLILEAGGANSDELQRAENGIDTLRRNHLSKYNDFPLDPPDLPDGFVLVIDQTYNDASVSGSGADGDTFAQMLADARRDHPDTAIIIKTHPEVMAGRRAGYFGAGDVVGQTSLWVDPVSPWHLFAKAKAVYTVSSQLGMEAIFAGHKPVVYGNAFYSGWGLTADRHPKTKLNARRTAAQLFSATYLTYCAWYDPIFDRRSSFEATAQTLTAQANAMRGAQSPVICHAMRLWKRGFLKSYLFGPAGAPRFIEDAPTAIAEAKRLKGSVAVWAGKETRELNTAAKAADVPLLRVEDGFLRSAGLGAELVQPVSLVFDDLGIYYDPTRESRLERVITAAVCLPEYELQRAENLRQNIVKAGLSKYNLGGDLPEITAKSGQKIILVPGQVEDDASILKGADKVTTNLDLIHRTRALFPNDYLIYKPHPDVQKGLRKGKINAGELADTVMLDADISALLDKVDIVSTMTSLTGFEALLRGKKVICFGAPFYAGWGLTQDEGPTPPRRQARPTLAALIHATLIGYPRYWDPVTGSPCAVETVLERLATGSLGRGSGRSVRLLAKAQGLFASYAYLWR